MLVAILCTLFAGQAWGDSFTIKFSTGSNDGTTASTSTSCATIVSEGASYLTGNLVTATKVNYSGLNGLKLGTSSAAGAIKMNLANSVTATTIVVKAALYNESKSATLSVNGSTAQTLSGSTFNNYTFDINGDISYLQLNSSKYCWINTITVNFEGSGADTYSVTYDANGGSGTMTDDDSPYASGATVTVLDNEFTREGYTFSRWNTESNGSGTSYAEGATFIINANTTLYAQWEEAAAAGTKKLTFDVSSNPGEWPTANSTTLTEYTYTLNSVDYTFALKNVKCNSGYLMMTQPAALGLPALPGYKLTKVEVTNSSGCSTATEVGISSTSSSASYISGGAAQTWSTTSTTYTYTLSSTAENTMYYMYVTTKNAQVTEIKLTYEEAERTYSVTYNANDADSGTVPSDATVYTDANNTVTVLGNTGSLAKAGYTFGGWNTSRWQWNKLYGWQYIYDF